MPTRRCWARGIARRCTGSNPSPSPNPDPKPNTNPNTNPNPNPNPSPHPNQAVQGSTYIRNTDGCTPSAWLARYLDAEP
eukprot:scaffold89270_cov60-Phaeocystis_antarctica.AAC.1